MYAIAFKLHTLVQCHKVTLYNKFHNSDFKIYEIIAPFYLEILVNLFQLPGFDSVILTLYSHSFSSIFFLSLFFTLMIKLLK